MDELRSESVAPGEPVRRRHPPRATHAAARERALSALARLKPAREPRPLSAEPSWTFPELAGRLVEIHGEHGGVLSLAARLVHDAQRRGELAAWVLARDTSFFPPDLADGGIDLEGLVVVRAPTPGGGARAADLLMRSGAFGLVVLELGNGRRAAPGADGEFERVGHPRRVSLRVPSVGGARRAVDEFSRDDDVPLALQSRLLAAAQMHDAIVLCVSTKPHGSSSLGSLVSLFGEVELSRVGSERSLTSPERSCSRPEPSLESSERRRASQERPRVSPECSCVIPEPPCASTGQTCASAEPPCASTGQTCASAEQTCASTGQTCASTGQTCARAGPPLSSAVADDSGASGFVCTLHVKKDKRRAPGWRHVEVCRGPLGLR
ncbi:MAG: hypothetical protein L6Q99_22475 [Planctomycetes bacterium]|nr:hypothetical protein [Planctomycetota bacterium]